MSLRSAGRRIVDKLPVSDLRVRGDMSPYDIVGEDYHLVDEYMEMEDVEGRKRA